MSKKLLVTIDSRVRLGASVLDLIPLHVQQELKDSFRHENPEWLKKKRMNLPTYGEPRTYVTWRDEPDGSMSFPRGGFHRVRAILEQAHIGLRVVDARTRGVSLTSLVGRREPQEVPKHRMELRDYQEEALEAAVAKENCIIRAPTGSGKTTIGFAAYSCISLPTLVIVWSGGLFSQWLERAEKELGYKRKHIGIIRAGKVKLKPLTIAMQQSLASVFEQAKTEPAMAELAEEIKQTFGCVICDEVQRFAARTLFDAVDPFAAKFRIGISADETRKDRKEFLIYDLFGQPAADIPRQRLVEAKHVLDVEVRVVPTRFDSNVRNDFNGLLAEMTTSEHRNQLIDTIVNGECNQRGQQVVVLSHRREHCVELDARFSRMGLKSGTMLGGPADEARFQETLAGLRNGDYKAATATYGAFGTGMDVPQLAVGVVATPLATNRQQFGQVRGRFCRPGKAEARLYYLWDRAYYGLKHLENLIRWNTRVLVLDDGKWVDGKEFVKSIRNFAA